MPHTRPRSVQYTAVRASTCGVRSGSRSAWRSSKPQEKDLHTHRGTYVLTLSLCPVLMLSMACPALLYIILPFHTMPCPSECAMPCHALPRPVPSLVAPCPQPGRAHPPSLRLTFPQPTVQPSRRSAHKQDFTWVSELLQQSVLCPVLPCPVPQSRCPTCPASLSICQSANLSLPRDLISVCDSRFDSLCSLCFALLCSALQCFALLPLARLTSPTPSRLLPLNSGRHHHLPSGRRRQSLNLAHSPMA